MRHEINESEALFARLCSDAFYGRFVYLNPKFYDPTEKEAGDVILWVRDRLVIFEVVWRSRQAQVDTKSLSRGWEKREINYSGTLTDLSVLVSRMRNHLAHGSTIMHGQPVAVLQMCAELINELFH